MWPGLNSKPSICVSRWETKQKDTENLRYMIAINF